MMSEEVLYVRMIFCVFFWFVMSEYVLVYWLVIEGDMLGCCWCGFDFIVDLYVWEMSVYKSDMSGICVFGGFDIDISLIKVGGGISFGLVCLGKWNVLVIYGI